MVRYHKDFYHFLFCFGEGGGVDIAHVPKNKFSLSLRRNVFLCIYSNPFTGNMVLSRSHLVMGRQGELAE